MADNKDYVLQPLEGGNVMISEDVIASIAALAVREVEGVYGMSTTAAFDLSNLIGKKNLRRGIRVAINGDKIEISCNLVVKMGEAVMNVAAAVQNAMMEEVTAMTSIRPQKVNVNVCGIAIPKNEQGK